MSDTAQTPEPTVQQKIDALRLGAKCARENGDDERAASIERSADVLENPDLPPTADERCDALQLQINEMRVFVDAMVICVALTNCGSGKVQDLRDLAGLVEAAVNSETDALAKAAVRAGRVDAATLLRRIAKTIEDGPAGNLVLGTGTLQ